LFTASTGADGQKSMLDGSLRLRAQRALPSRFDSASWLIDQHPADKGRALHHAHPGLHRLFRPSSCTSLIRHPRPSTGIVEAHVKHR
jgi:hypothetical protein